MEFSLDTGILFTSPAVAGIFLVSIGYAVFKNLELGLAVFTVCVFILKAIHFQAGIVPFIGAEKSLLYPYMLFLGICVVMRFRSFHLAGFILRSQIVLLVCAFIVSWLMSYLVNPSDEYSMRPQELIESFSRDYAPFFSLILVSCNAEKLDRYLRYIVRLCVVVSALYLVQYFFGLKAGIPLAHLRVVPLFDLYLGSGAVFACLAFIAGAVGFFSSEGKSRLPCAVTMFISTAVLIVSVTRIYWFAMSLTFVYLGIKLIPRHRWVLMVPVMASAFLFLSILSTSYELPAIGGKVASSVAERFNRTLEDPLGSGGIRAESYSNAIGIFFESPIIGVGPGNSGILGYQMDYSRNLVVGVYRHSVHSFYIAVLAEQGMTGMLIFLVLLLLVMGMSASNSRISRGNVMLWPLDVFSTGVLIVALISGLTGTSSFLFWGIGLVLVTSYWRRLGQGQGPMAFTKC